MIFGAWIHPYDDLPLAPQVAQAAAAGLRSVRSYSIDYAKRIAPALQQNGFSLLGGYHVDSAALLTDWRSQFRPDVLQAYHDLGVPLSALCIGNELREGGDAPESKRFTARLAFGLASLLRESRRWLDDHGYATPVTYAIEEIVYGPDLTFYDYVWPMLDACDIVSINAYPMGPEAWFTYGAFDESRRFLQDPRTRNDRLAAYNYRLRAVLAQLESAGKPAFLSETGFPSAVGYRTEGTYKGNPLIVPVSDNTGYAEVMAEFLAIIRQINSDYHDRLKAIYFYEWRDNLYHSKIWNIEQSPIHTAFGLCDRTGNPKFDIGRLLSDDSR